MLTARRFWIAHNHLTPLPAKNLRPNTTLNNLHLNNSTTSSTASGTKTVNNKGNGSIVLTTNNEIKTNVDKFTPDDISDLLKKDI